MNDRVRGGIAVALVALVVIGVGIGGEIPGVITGGFVILGIAAISIAAGITQGMSRDDEAG
jgi:hypothetical protein